MQYAFVNWTKVVSADPNDTESISSSIVKVLDSKNYANKLINLGYEHVKHFSWELCAKQTFEIYKKLL